MVIFPLAADQIIAQMWSNGAWGGLANCDPLHCSMVHKSHISLIDWLIDWLRSVLRPLQHSIGYMGDGFYRSKDPTKYQSTEGESCKGKQHNKHKEDRNYTYAYTHKIVDKYSVQL